MSPIPTSLRRLVQSRANNCCEYCRLHQFDNPFAFHVEHIISVKHEGETEADNLCWSCPECNAYKGTDIGSIDPVTRMLTPLFNPRTHDWFEHFEIDHDSATLVPLTPEARVTVKLLRLNSEEQVTTRQTLMRLGRYPCI